MKIGVVIPAYNAARLLRNLVFDFASCILLRYKRFLDLSVRTLLQFVGSGPEDSARFGKLTGMLPK